MCADIKLFEELAKVEKIGFEPVDSMWWDNSLWVPKQQKIYLIDVDRWERVQGRS